MVRCIGASMTPFMVSPQWNTLYILLAKEHSVPGWEWSGTWSDFGGAVKAADADPEGTAAREFHEETLGVVPFAESEAPKHGGAYRRSAAVVADALRAGAFTLRMGCSSEGSDVGYVTFCKQLQWMPVVMDTFQQYYHRARRHNLPVGHPARGPGGRVRADYLEKVEVRLFSVAECRRMIAGQSQAVLRPNYAVRLARILDHLPADGVCTACQPRPWGATQINYGPIHENVVAAAPPPRVVAGPPPGFEGGYEGGFHGEPGRGGESAVDPDVEGDGRNGWETICRRAEPPTAVA